MFKKLIMAMMCIALCAGAAMAADLNDTEKKLVGKWRVNEQENLDGMVINEKTDMELSADLTMTVKAESKGKLDMGLGDDQIIYFGVEFSGKGTWSATETVLTGGLDPDTFKAKGYVKCNDDSQVMVRQLMDQLEAMINQQMIPSIKEELCTPSDSNIVSIEDKKFTIKDESSPKPLVYKRVK